MTYLYYALFEYKLFLNDNWPVKKKKNYNYQLKFLGSWNYAFSEPRSEMKYIYKDTVTPGPRAKNYLLCLSREIYSPDNGVCIVPCIWMRAPELFDIKCRSLRLFSSCLTTQKASPQDEDMFDNSHTLIIHLKGYHYFPFPS